MSNDTITNHVFTHEGVSIFKKTNGSKYDSCKAVISKDCKDYSLLQFANAKEESTKAQLEALRAELGWKQLTNTEKDALTKEEKRKHTLLTKKIDSSSELDAFNDARHDVSIIQNNIKNNVIDALINKVKYKDDLVSILIENGFVEADGMYVYKIDETNGFSVSIRGEYKHDVTVAVHFYESEYREFTDRETKEKTWHWTMGSTKASVVYEGYMESHLMFKAHNFYISNVEQFENMNTLISTAQHIFNVMKQHEADYQTLELVEKTYEYELAS